MQRSRGMLRHACACTHRPLPPPGAAGPLPGHALHQLGAAAGLCALLRHGRALAQARQVQGGAGAGMGQRRRGCWVAGRGQTSACGDARMSGLPTLQNTESLILALCTWPQPGQHWPPLLAAPLMRPAPLPPAPPPAATRTSTGTTGAPGARGRSGRASAGRARSLRPWRRTRCSTPRWAGIHSTPVVHLQYHRCTEVCPLRTELPL